MALTEMQKKIINDNPKTSVRELAKMVGCTPRTITNYKNRLKEKIEKSVEKVETQDGKNLACAHEQKKNVEKCTVENLRTSNLILTPEDLFKLGTTVCAQEFALYNLATAKLATDPDNPKYLWTQKQHREGIERMVTVMGKWHGMDRESVITNILNVNNKVNVVSSDKVAQFEKFMRESDPNAL